MAGKKWIPKPLFRVYQHRVRTLEDAIISLLPPPPVECRCEGRKCLSCSGMEFLVRVDDSAEYKHLLRKCFVVFSEDSPRLTSLDTACHSSQHQIVARTIKLMIPSNTLCNHYVIDPLSTLAWELLLTRIGDVLMGYLLRFGSIFLPHGHKDLHQVAGVPINNVGPKLSEPASALHHQPASIADSGTPTKGMSLTIKSIKGSVFRVRVQPGDTIMRVKELIEESKGKGAYPHEEQLLVFKGKVMKNQTTLGDHNVGKFDFVFLLLCKPYLHGTTIVTFKLKKSVVIGGDGRRTSRFSVVSDRIKKIELFGKNIMIGTCGDGDFGDRIRRTFKGFIKILEKHKVDLSVGDCARRAYEVLKAVNKCGEEETSFAALFAGIEAKTPRMFVVNGAGYWEEEDWYCIGSGASYGAIEANKMTPFMEEKDAVELAFRSIFTAAVNSFCTGGSVRVMVMTQTSNGVRSIEYSRTISELMDTYGIKFSENSMEIKKTFVKDATDESPPLSQPYKRQRKFERSGRKTHMGV